MVMRPLSRSCSVSTNPWSTSPTRFWSGTETSSRISSAVSLERMPSLPCSGRCEKPFMPRSSAKAVMPFCRREGLVRASTTKTSPTEPWVMNIFAPFSTQPLPLRTAVVRIPAASDPLPASVRPQAASFLPEAMSGMNRRRSSSDPNRRMCEVPSPLCEATVSASDPSQRAISSTTIARLTVSSCEPPSSSGTAMPRSPSSPRCATTSRGNCSLRSHSAACGFTSRTQKSLTISTSLRWLSVGSNSIISPECSVSPAAPQIHPKRSARNSSTTGLDRGDAAPLGGAGAVALRGGCEAGDDLVAQAVAWHHRFQHLLGGQLEDVDVCLVFLAKLLHVRGALGLGPLLDLVVVDGVHGRFGSHHRDHRLRQRDGGIRLEARPAESVEAGAVRLADHHAQLGDRRLADCHDHLGARPDDSLALHLRPDHEARHVGQIQERHAEGVAQPDETGRLVRAVDEEHAALVLRLAGDDPDRLPVDAGEAGDHLRREQLLDLEQAVRVHQLADERAHLEELVLIGRDQLLDALPRRRGPDGLRHGHGRCEVLGQIAEVALARLDRLLLRLHQDVAAAGDGAVHARATQLLERHLLPDDHLGHAG